MYSLGSSLVCLYSESGMDHGFYLENYLYCSLDIMKPISRSSVGTELVNDYISQLCRKSFTVGKLNSEEWDEIRGKKKVEHDKDSENHNKDRELKEKRLKEIKSNAIKFASLTATYLDWCRCSMLQTDSTFACNYVSNHWMRSSNGNGKVKYGNAIPCTVLQGR